MGIVSFRFLFPFFFLVGSILYRFERQMYDLQLYSSRTNEINESVRLECSCWLFATRFIYRQTDEPALSWWRAYNESRLAVFASQMKTRETYRCIRMRRFGRAKNVDSRIAFSRRYTSQTKGNDVRLNAVCNANNSSTWSRRKSRNSISRVI